MSCSGIHDPDLHTYITNKPGDFTGVDPPDRSDLHQHAGSTRPHAHSHYPSGIAREQPKKKGGRRGYADETVLLICCCPPKGEAEGINSANVIIVMTAFLMLIKQMPRKRKSELLGKSKS